MQYYKLLTTCVVLGMKLTGIMPKIKTPVLPIAGEIKIDTFFFKYLYHPKTNELQMGMAKSWSVHW